MSTGASNLVYAFDALPLADKQLVAIEILRRSVSLEELPPDTFDSLASDVFQQYDAEESAGGES